MRERAVATDGLEAQGEARANQPKELRVHERDELHRGGATQKRDAKRWRSVQSDEGCGATQRVERRSV